MMFGALVRCIAGAGSVLALTAAVIALSSRFLYVFISFKQRY